MSISSPKTASTWQKPLRESDRVAVSPGMPARAVSRGKAICFSISVGPSAGYTVVIWTIRLLMSGTASMGRRSRAKAP